MRDSIPGAFAFELSNRCNLSQCHDLCPTVATDPPVFLNTDIIKDTMKYFGSVNHKCNIYFNVYNEPTIDPRLFMLLEYNMEHGGGSGVSIFTNGWSINQYMVDELLKLNAHLSISCYTDAEHERLKQFSGVTGCTRSVLEPKVKQLYDATATRTGVCLFPSVYGIINHKGQYGLCCREWKWNHPLGDLSVNTIKEVLDGEERTRICDELESGVRSLDACKRCPFPGWGVVDDPYVG